MHSTMGLMENAPSDRKLGIMNMRACSSSTCERRARWQLLSIDQEVEDSTKLAAETGSTQRDVEQGMKGDEA